MNQNIYMFNDEIRSVDFVLIHKSTKDCERAYKRRKEMLRNTYITKLKEAGLMVEHGEINHISFLKVHVPQQILYKYCDALQIRMPIRNVMHVSLEKKSVSEDSLYRRLKCSLGLPEHLYQPTAEFLTGRLDLFDVNSKNFFSPTVRNMIANIILNNIQFTDYEDENIGLEKMTGPGNVFEAAFPLHDGSTRQVGSEREKLLNEWGAFKKIVTSQPMDRIKEYFGIKIAMYFLWLGFYTYMLVPAAIVGVVCLLFGWATLSTDHLGNDVCSSSLNFTMCPQCDTYCDYWNLLEACGYARVTYLFDNDMTVFFAIFMTFWSTLYLELWKRYSLEMTHRWGLSGFDLQNEYPRHQYREQLRRKGKVNFWRNKLPSVVFSFTIAISVVLLAVGAVFSVVIYRMSVRTSSVIFSDDTNSFNSLFIPVTAGLLNLVSIFILNICYDYLAERLTELEYQRTQTEFDDSLTLKIYIFQFVNFYSSIFYIAFLKGKFVGYPENYNRLFEYRQEECSPGGCLTELCMQLAIVMIGKQTMNNIIEILMPFLRKKYLVFKNKGEDGSKKEMTGNSGVGEQIIEDFNLLSWTSRELFPEYLEMVIQYGFVTIFVTALPLAPLLALINNLIEIRLDAKKFLKYYRRPIAERMKDIGVWFKIINALSVLSVISNAIIIAFSSNFVPEFVYKMTVSPNYSGEGYLNFSLSYFDVKDLQSVPVDSRYNVTHCRYPGYRTPPWHEQKYNYTTTHWHIIAARLVFVVVYQNVVSLVVMAVQWAIPDVPKRVQFWIKKESMEIRNFLIQNPTEVGCSDLNDFNYGFGRRQVNVHFESFYAQ